MRTIIIDDELDSIHSLEADLGFYCPEVEIVGTFSDPREALGFLQKSKVDLVFLDIAMPIMDGFELLKKLDTIDFEVIFVTAYDEYAIRAFDFNAIDYVLKPVKHDKLKLAVQKAKNKNDQYLNKDRLEALLNNIELQTNINSSKIALPTSEGFDFVDIDDIMYAKSEGNYSWIFISSGEKYLISKTLKKFCNVVCANHFKRVHHSYLININHAKKYIKGPPPSLVMSDDTSIPVGRAYKNNLADAIGL